MFSRNKAIIIGGGIAGKLAARVLSDFFKEVVIIEQDQEPEGPFPRKGVRQGEHLHALLLAGQYGLEELFPGITEKFYLSGAVKINSTKDLAWFHHGVWKLRFDGGYRTTLQTRPHLEWHIQQYIDRISNISFHYNQVVKDYLFNANENRIYGVEMEARDHSIKTVTADLIVDASGVSSITTYWLKNRGINIPNEKVDIGLSYVSKSFQLPDSKARDWKIKIVYPNPPHEKIGGTISKVEGEKYIVTINGYQNEIQEKEVVKNDNGFLELSKKLPKLDIYEEIKNAIPLSKTSIYRVPQIIWKRYDKVKNLPHGLLLIGDTVCRIDPVFGQGMSISVLEALALQKRFQDRSDSLQKIIPAFHKKTAKIIAPIWNMVIVEDFRYPTISGKKPIGLTFQQWFAKNIFLLSSENEMIYNTFIKVMNLVQPMTILMHPKILRSVLARSFFTK
ncbi:NAD(P)/FAD-dependent oxidoreductase [Bacillus sp. EB600]|uniref:NAD(P)/FAD-dependent oxidoreductase n=1 Tax=Bacillus sp. EB600 TaxID=2806345 RepID=UPI00210AEEDF|nr:FAD-dependent monooxygenase [Bacillus sp. EB600]MCQ6281315.1 FAD-dependent monooxygenase [Bacillus sp. EB600]